jgi:hypothetical protein
MIEGAIWCPLFKLSKVIAFDDYFKNGEVEDCEQTEKVQYYLVM